MGIPPHCLSPTTSSEASEGTSPSRLAPGHQPQHMGTASRKWVFVQSEILTLLPHYQEAWPRGLGNHPPHVWREGQRGGQDAHGALLTHEFANESMGLNASHLDMDVCLCAYLGIVVGVDRTIGTVNCNRQCQIKKQMQHFQKWKDSFSLTKMEVNSSWSTESESCLL